MTETNDLTVYLLFLNFSKQAEDALPIQLLEYLHEQTKLPGHGELQEQARGLRKYYKSLSADDEKSFKLMHRDRFKEEVQDLLSTETGASSVDNQRLRESALTQIEQSRADEQKIELLEEACILLRCSEESLIEYIKQLLHCKQCLKHVSKSLSECRLEILEQRELIVGEQMDFRRFLKESFKEACILTAKLETTACRTLKELSCKKYYFNINESGYVLDQFMVEIDGVERIFDGVFEDFSEFEGNMRGKVHFCADATLLRAVFELVCKGCVILRCCRADAGLVEDVFGREVVEHRVQLTEVRFEAEDESKLFEIFTKNPGAILWAEEENCFLFNGGFVSEFAVEMLKALGITANYECVSYSC